MTIIHADTYGSMCTSRNDQSVQVHESMRRCAPENEVYTRAKSQRSSSADSGIGEGARSQMLMRALRAWLATWNRHLPALHFHHYRMQHRHVNAQLSLRSPEGLASGWELGQRVCLLYNPVKTFNSPSKAICLRDHIATTPSAPTRAEEMALHTHPFLQQY